MMLFRPTICAIFVVAACVTHFAATPVSAQQVSPQFTAERAVAEVNTRNLTAPVAVQNGGPPAVPNTSQDHHSGPGVAADPVNPLWITPLASLTPTRERPIFSPSRRPPAVPEPIRPPPPAPVSGEQRKPSLTLLGAILGEGEGKDLAIFRDDTTKAIVRLKPGEGHSGWTLQAVEKREAILQKERDTAVFELPPK
jgi:hypothetical protein